MLDRTVINFYLALSDQTGNRYEKVQCAFGEGGPAFRGSGMTRDGHTQVAVRNPACIPGDFRPR